MRHQKHKDRYLKYEKPLPGNQLQVDVKFLDKIQGQTKRFYQNTAINFMDSVLSKLPFRIDCVQTDNGAELQQLFKWHIEDQGIKHKYIKPRTPHLNGKVERSHRIDDEEFYKQLEGIVISDMDEFNKRLAHWQNYYNYHRPHGSLGGETPYEKLKSRLNQSVT